MFRLSAAIFREMSTRKNHILMQERFVVIFYKHNTSVDNTILYLYIKIVYFVRATCFDLISSSSGPPRRQIQELFMFHCISWVRRDQLDVTCFIISLFNAQHVSDVNTSIIRNLRLISWVISWVVLIWFDVCWCYVVVWLWWCGTRMQAEAVPQPAYGYHNTMSHTEIFEYF